MYLHRARECPEEWSALRGQHQPSRTEAQAQSPMGQIKAVAAASCSCSPSSCQGPCPHFHSSFSACNTNTNVEAGTAPGPLLCVSTKGLRHPGGSHNTTVGGETSGQRASCRLASASRRAARLGRRGNGTKEPALHWKASTGTPRCSPAPLQCS